MSKRNLKRKAKKTEWSEEKREPHPHFSKAIKTLALTASLPSLKKILLKPPACVPFHVPFASLPGGNGFYFEHLCFNAKVQARDGRQGTTLSLLFKSFYPFYLFGFPFSYIISQAIPVVGFVSFVFTTLFFNIIYSNLIMVYTLVGADQAIREVMLMFQKQDQQKGCFSFGWLLN